MDLTLWVDGGRQSGGRQEGGQLSQVPSRRLGVHGGPGTGPSREAVNLCAREAPGTVGGVRASEADRRQGLHVR